MILRKNPSVSLKLRYPIAVRVSTLISVLMLITILVAFPRFKTKEFLEKEIQIEIEQLVESVAEKNINIQIISKDEEEEMLKLRKEGNLSKAKFYRLQKSINEFGPVNLLAPEEYLKLEEKYDFIDKQLTDLDTSLMNLEKTIKPVLLLARVLFFILQFWIIYTLFKL